MNNNKFQKSIISFILCFFMLFSNVVSAFAYEWDLEVPPIVNGSNDITINGSSDITNNQAIINGSNDNSITTSNNNNININNNNINSNTENNKVINNTNVIEEQNILTKNGRTVKAKIEPVYKNLTRAGMQTFVLKGSSNKTDATVAFKGDELNAREHKIIDFITRHNGDTASVGYCVLPFYA